MKRLLLLFAVCFSSSLIAQNEFSAKAFYTDFNKVCEEAKRGFQDITGKEKISEFPGLTKEYAVKLILPLADSGKVIFPDFSRPYALYYFEPSRNRLKTDQKGADLREAIIIAMNRPVCTRTETTLVADIPVSNTWFFEGNNESAKTEAICQISIFSRNNLYYLTLQINGNRSIASAN